MKANKEELIILNGTAVAKNDGFLLCVDTDNANNTIEAINVFRIQQTFNLKKEWYHFNVSKLFNK